MSSKKGPLEISGTSSKHQFSGDIFHGAEPLQIDEIGQGVHHLIHVLLHVTFGRSFAQNQGTKTSFSV